jgi:DNA-binding NarL/FixJ family response regulator
MTAEEKDATTREQRHVFIVEDHPIFRLGLRELINQEDDLFVCGESDDVGKALKEIQRLRPDLAIVDISLKGRSGIDLVKDLGADCKDLPVLVLSMYDETLYAERALQAGAKGYIMKQETSESIVKAVRSVLGGKMYLSENVMGDILGRFVGKPATAEKTPIARLTDRELEVFRLIGQGLTTNQIAKQLSLSGKTIGTYRERIKEKLNLKNAAELTRHAVRWLENEQA